MLDPKGVDSGFCHAAPARGVSVRLSAAVFLGLSSCASSCPPALLRADKEPPVPSGRSATRVNQENLSFSARPFAKSGSTVGGFRLGGVRASSSSWRG